MGEVVDLGAGEDTSGVSDDEHDAASEMENAVENVADAVCMLWEVTGGDVDASVVTVVDGHLVRITVSVDMA